MSDRFDAGQLATLDADARRIIGKPIGQCTIADLTEIIRVCTAETTWMRAEIDQAEMIAREATRCGCRVAVPIRPDGTRDLGRAVVHHTCGGAA